MTANPYRPRRATAVKKGEVLRAEASHAVDPNRRIRTQTYRSPVWDPALAGWFGRAAEGEEVEIEIHVTVEGTVGRVWLAGTVRPDETPRERAEREETEREERERSTAVQQRKGFVNPYTFVPTPPRGDLAAGGTVPGGTGSAPPVPGPDRDGDAPEPRQAVVDPTAPGRGTAPHDVPATVTGPATGLADSGAAGPPSHALHGRDQWSGRLALRLTARTPLLLPDQQSATEDPRAPGRRVVATRTDPGTGRPLLPCTSVKGALRSAFETVTASRYGVFAGHDLPLAYRAPAQTGSGLVPALLVRWEGREFFRLCRGDTGWHPDREREPEVQFAAWVPAYTDEDAVPRARLLGGLPDRSRRLGDLHAAPVHARVRLYRVSPRNRSGTGMCRVWVVTHLADGPEPLSEHLSGYEDPAELGTSLKLVAGTGPRTVRGVLSATGRSIDRKRYERLFVTTARDVLVPVTEEHRRSWTSVVESYLGASRYHDPADGLERSWHVEHAEEIKDLPAAPAGGPPRFLPVYVSGPDGRRPGDGAGPERAAGKGTGSPTILEAQEVARVHPVMIGRLPFDGSPLDLLDPTLRPATDLSELSPADRLFGWSADGPDPSRYGRRESCGYRGRLSVRTVACRDGNWRRKLPGQGVVMAPLSAPQPTQFRFYAARDPQGRPVRRRAGKGTGYAPGTGLRGRKHYRWSDLPAGYWEPRMSEQDGERIEVRCGDRAETRYREYLDPVTAPTQTVRHRDWIRPGVTFDVEIFLDGVPTAEAGALLWLLLNSQEAPLRLGSGKPYGFGVVTAEIVWNDDGDGGPEPTALWDGEAVAEGWRSLARPAPASRDRLEALADRFERLARRHPLLSRTLAAYRAANRAVGHPVHYPRSRERPMAESYEWFTENERTETERRGSTEKERKKTYETVEGWALPDVGSEEPRLPILPKKKDDDKPRDGGKRGGGPRNR